MSSDYRVLSCAASALFALALIIANDKLIHTRYLEVSM